MVFSRSAAPVLVLGQALLKTKGKITTSSMKWMVKAQMNATTGSCGGFSPPESIKRSGRKLNWSHVLALQLLRTDDARRFYVESSCEQVELLELPTTGHTSD